MLKKVFKKLHYRERFKEWTLKDILVQVNGKTIIKSFFHSGVLFGCIIKSQYIALNATSLAKSHVDSFDQMSHLISKSRFDLAALFGKGTG